MWGMIVLILATLLGLTWTDAVPEVNAIAKSIGSSAIAGTLPITPRPPHWYYPVNATAKSSGSLSKSGIRPITPLPPLRYNPYWPRYNSTLGYNPYWRYPNRPEYKKGHFSHYISSYPYRDQPEVPACAAETTKNYCLIDREYPTQYIKDSLTYHYHAVLSLYDNTILSTARSVKGKYSIRDETYLCPSETKYVQPLRAKNTNGKWRMIVNKVFGNHRSFNQNARMEECLSSGESCPLVPDCYETKCVQKSVIQHFLVYDPADRYLPFAIEAFKFPASCACFIGAYRK